MIGGICDIYFYEDAFFGMTFETSSMKIGTDINAILRFCHSNLNDRSIGVTNGNGLRSTPLRSDQMA
jgi:hypothetical protein